MISGMFADVMFLNNRLARFGSQLQARARLIQLAK